MSDPQTVEISYREGMTEVGIVIDDETVVWISLAGSAFAVG